MKRILFLAGMLLVVVAAFGSPNYRIVSEGPVNIYEGPSSAVSVIGTVNGGDTVEVLIVENGWATLWLGNRNGYVEEVFIAPLSETYKVVTPKSGDTAVMTD